MRSLVFIFISHIRRSWDITLVLLGVFPFLSATAVMIHVLMTRSVARANKAYEGAR
jgi:hypothetical protein